MSPEREAIQKRLAQKKVSPERASIQKRLKARSDEATFLKQAADGVTKDPSVLGMDMGSTGETINRLGAGLASGLMNVGQGVGNMVGLVDDETINERKLLERPLSDTTAGSVGQFTGEMAGLAPLGLVGKPLQAAHKLYKGAKGLPTAQKVLAGGAGAGVAALEGAGAGAVLANPNERGTGALKGATAGAALNRTLAGLGRFGKDGLVKISKEAEGLGNYVEKLTGNRPFIPLAQAADDASGALSNTGKVAMFASSLLPSAKNKFHNQARALEDDVYEANIRQVLGTTGKDMADKGVEVFRRDGDVLQGLEAAVKSKKNPVFSKSQDILEDAASNKAGRYTPQQLLKAATRNADKGNKSGAPLRAEAKLMEGVLPKPVTMSDVFTRDMYRQATETVGKTTAGLPGLGSILASKGVQNFLMGSTMWQRRLKGVLDSNDPHLVTEFVKELGHAARIAASGQPAQSDESNDFKTPQGVVTHYGNEAANLLRGLTDGS